MKTIAVIDNRAESPIPYEAIEIDRSIYRTIEEVQEAVAELVDRMTYKIDVYLMETIDRANLTEEHRVYTLRA